VDRLKVPGCVTITSDVLHGVAYRQNIRFLLREGPEVLLRVGVNGAHDAAGERWRSLQFQRGSPRESSPLRLLVAISEFWPGPAMRALSTCEVAEECGFLIRSAHANAF
jgi:hypothetical protein